MCLIHISLAARFRTTDNSGTRVSGLAIIRADFVLLAARRAFKALGLMSSRFDVEQILPMIRKAARAFCLRLAVGILWLLCNGTCTTKRLHVDNEEQTLRAGCPDEPDCLSHYNKCSLLSLSLILDRIWSNAWIRLRGNLLFHDLVTQILRGSLQHGIVVVWIYCCDPFVHAHNYHWHSMDNQVIFEDCIEGRIRFLTAITPSYAHAHQAFCLTGRSADIPFQRCRLSSAKAKYLNLPNNRTTTPKRWRF